MSDELKKVFPNAVPVIRPSIANQTVEDPNWIAGFTSAEGCFYIKIQTTAVSLVFSIVQHSRDIALMKSLASYFGCGQIASRNIIRHNKI